MHLATLVLALLLQCLPRRWLLARVRARLGQPAGQLQDYFSGRVAIEQIARQVRAQRAEPVADTALPVTQPVALVPRYLCNVVPLALVRAGWQVQEYEVDAAFRPDPAALRAQVQATRAGLLVLAPLYGADGGIADWLTADADRFREREQLFLLLDCCQDLAIFRRSVLQLGSNCAAVCSGNDKSVPGVMGALVVAGAGFRPPVPPAARWRTGWQVNRLALVRIWHLLRGRRRPPPDRYEFSRCRQFPWNFDTVPGQRLQLACALLGLRWWPRWLARRAAAVQRGEVRLLALPGSSAAPFVVCLGDDPGRHRRKPPYALAEDADRSARPDLVIAHNKGFDDF